MAIYLIQYAFPTAIALIACYLVFHFCLRKETFFGINRTFLLFSILFSFLLPFIHFSVRADFAIEPIYSAALNEVIIDSVQNEAITERSFSPFSLVAMIYLAGCLFFFVKMAVETGYILHIIRKNGVVKYRGSKVVFMTNNLPHFSFFNLIFINKKHIRNDFEQEIVIEHEREHIRKAHFADLIVLEIAQIVQWFNPVVYFYVRSLKTVHEYEADEKIIEKGVPKPDYMNLMFQQVSGYDAVSLVNKFNFSNLKKRILMIQKTKSSGLAKVKLLLSIPVVAGLLICFSVNSLYSGNPSPLRDAEAMVADTTVKKAPVKEPLKGEIETVEWTPDMLKENEQDEIFRIVEKHPEYPGGDKARLQFLQENLKYPQDARELGKEGTVYIGFVVEKDGSISDIKIIRGVYKSIDEECIRVVSLMPKWIPGKQDGKIVRTAFNMPVKFTLGLEAEKEEKR